MKFTTCFFLCFLSLACFGADGYLARTNGNIVIGPGGSGGSQTPWTSDINGGGFTLTNANANLTTITGINLYISTNFDGSLATNLNASQLLSGTVPSARLDTLQNQYPNAITNSDTRALTFSGPITNSSYISLGVNKIQFATNGSFAVSLTNGTVSATRIKPLRSDGQTAEFEAQEFDIVNSASPGTRVYYFNSVGWRVNGNGTMTITLNDSTLGLNSTTNISLTGGLLINTNYSGVNLTPVAGYVKLVASNGVLFAVSQQSTNIVSPGP